jgi:uncharacterized protein (TIGR00369 family)
MKTAHSAPEGFASLRTEGEFTRANGPLYVKRANGRVWMGFWVERRHTNPMGMCHGGMMATFCDMLLPVCGHYLVPALARRFLPTVSLQVDYLAPSHLGDWVEGEAQVLRTTATLAFIQGLVTADGQPVARASGVFKIGPVYEQPEADI